MNTIAQLQQFEISSDRLKHILDKLGFHSGRGRTKNFHEILKENSPDIFKELKYTTVRSWFQGSTSPSMEKVDSIIDVLLEEYSSDRNAVSLKTWWKVGGVYPFEEAHDSPSKEKMSFMITGIVTEMVGDKFNEINLDDLEEVRSKLTQLADDFANPNVTDVPRHVMQDFCARLVKDL
ncbi:MAG: hypothetical protein JKY09_09115 [Crocinitomicaceae bacterium]|nr:hypothetical protein [Crocinitomicaceae bacterium]